MLSIVPHAVAQRRALLVLLFALVAVPLATAEKKKTEAGGTDTTMPRVRLDTTLGEILLELDARRAPRTVENFLAYVDAGFYDDTLFHRVIEGFMIQGGGFTGEFARKRTRAPIPNEAGNGLSNRRYTISMARTNAPHSATSQFFINTADNPNLDHVDASPRGWGYAVFGRVVDGHDVVDAIARVATGPGGPFSRDAPRVPVAILEADRAAPAATTGAEPAPIDPPAAAEPTAEPAEPIDATDEPRGARAVVGALERAG